MTMTDLGEKIPLNKEVKVILLKALKNGFITRGKVEVLNKAFGTKMINIAFIAPDRNERDDNQQIGVGDGD